jgi:hypothetical protein
MGRYSSAKEAVRDITKSMTQSMNPDEFNPDLGNTRYHVEGTVYIFSTAKRDFEVSQPLFPRLTLKGCTNGERYVLSATVPNPVPQASPDLERGGRRMDYHDGWMCAIGLLYPESGFRDWIKGGQSDGISEGTNLIAQGLFPSPSNPPAESDIREAENFRNRRYKRLTDAALKAAAKSSRALADYLTLHEDVHDAMDALGMSADWHRKNEVLSSCPNCGDKVPSTVAFHKSTVTDRLCVIDPERAYRAKAITKEEYEELLTTPA